MGTDYKEIAKEVRRDVLTLLNKGQTSHAASNLSLTDLAVVLYENLRPEDKVIWSKGWAAALYYILASRKGIINREELFNTFPNAPYLGLLEVDAPGVITAGGSVGHGLSVGAGIAIGLKRAKEPGTVYVLMSDGELNEGSVWEAVMFAAHHKLSNLVAIVDVNDWQAMGKTDEVISMEPLLGKWANFGWRTREIDGHDHRKIENALTYLWDPCNFCNGRRFIQVRVGCWQPCGRCSETGKYQEGDMGQPSVIIARTI